jgi:putative NADH-flavin reductase
MKIVVFGANGPVGKLLVAQALREGHEVSAVTRRPTEFPLADARLRVLAGDVLDAGDVAQAVSGHDAVLSLVGVPYSRQPVSVYSIGITNILAAMQTAGVRRLIGVTSGGTNPHFAWAEGIIFGLILKRIIGRTLYADMRRMEAIMFASDCEWTIVRPARLIDTPSTTAYQTAEAYLVPGMPQTARRDLAAFMLGELAVPRFIRKAVALGSPRR